MKKLFIILFVILCTNVAIGQHGNHVMFRGTMCRYDSVTARLDTFAIMPWGNRCEINWMCDGLVIEFINDMGVSMNRFVYDLSGVEWYVSYDCEGFVRYRVFVDGGREVVIWTDSVEIVMVTILDHPELVILFLEP